jgi:hypothetical protein
MNSRHTFGVGFASMSSDSTYTGARGVSSINSTHVTYIRYMVILLM